jgi:hypothetical protein
MLLLCPNSSVRDLSILDGDEANASYLSLVLGNGINIQHLDSSVTRAMAFDVSLLVSFEFWIALSRPSHDAGLNWTST